MPKYWREEQLSDNSRAFLVASQNRPANKQVETVKLSCFFFFSPNPEWSVQWANHA